MIGGAADAVDRRAAVPLAQQPRELARLLRRERLARERQRGLDERDAAVEAIVGEQRREAAQVAAAAARASSARSRSARAPVRQIESIGSSPAAASKRWSAATRKPSPAAIRSAGRLANGTRLVPVVPARAARQRQQLRGEPPVRDPARHLEAGAARGLGPDHRDRRLVVPAQRRAHRVAVARVRHREQRVDPAAAVAARAGPRHRDRLRALSVRDRQQRPVPRAPDRDRRVGAAAHARSPPRAPRPGASGGRRGPRAPSLRSVSV